MIDARAEESWQELDRKLRPFVARRVPPRDVDDVLQEVFLRVQRGVATLRDDDRFGPWVYQVTRTTIVDHQRVAARHPLPKDAGTAEPLAIPDDDNGIEEELATYVAGFVAMLPSPYREALTLTELQGVSQKEAAAMLGISVSGMKSRVQRGRQRLRQLFEACCLIALDGRGRVVSCEPRPDPKLPCGTCLELASEPPPPREAPTP